MFTYLFKGETSKTNASNTITIFGQKLHNLLLNIELSIDNEGILTNLGLINKKDPFYNE